MIIEADRDCIITLAKRAYLGSQEFGTLVSGREIFISPSIVFRSG